MIIQDWWFTTLLEAKYLPCPPLQTDIQADVVIIGAGMAGVSAAASFIGSGLKVVLLERNILGGSSTGRSAGFLTPDSELELSQLIYRFGAKSAKEIWEVPCRGIESIVSNVKKFNIKCDLIPQDSLFLGLDKQGYQDVKDEGDTRASLGLASSLHPLKHLADIIGSQGYTGGLSYGDTYGINALQYVQGMKQVLLDAGILIYESTEVKSLEGHKAITHAGSVTADQLIICTDKMERRFNPIADEVFHAQTFLSISEPLSEKEVLTLFPSGKSFQCWDSSLIYTYFRMTGDNRLLVGGGSTLTTYLPNAWNHDDVIRDVHKGFKAHFPYLENLNFIQYWPGLIDSSRDLLPLIKRDAHAPYQHFVQGCVGLPWAAFCGDFVGRVLQGKGEEDAAKYYEYFSDRRPFLIPTWVEKIISKPITFALNNGYAKYYQVDKKRKPIEEKGEF